MVCYYHPDVPAIGLCKSCMRGLCSECAVELPQALACPGRCEEDVRQLHMLIQFNLAYQQTQRKLLGGQRLPMMVVGTFIALMGVLFAWIGFAAEPSIWPLAGLGTLFVGYGCWIIARSLLYRLPRPRPGSRSLE